MGHITAGLLLGISLVVAGPASANEDEQVSADERRAQAMAQAAEKNERVSDIMRRLEIQKVSSADETQNISCGCIILPPK
ncbi:MAG: hypothetical protein ACI8WB_003679 [Phenylobacterium sp.]|jgi:hypothetical protein